MKDSIARYKLDECCRYNEYNQTMDYATKNIGIRGVKEQVQKLEDIETIYSDDIRRITEVEKERENRKYRTWETWHRIYRICIYVSIGIVAIMLINGVMSNIMPRVLKSILSLLGCLIILMIPLDIVVKMGAVISGKVYISSIKKIKKKIDERNEEFAKESKKYYGEIDNLYLLSLDTTHREIVMMRREQDAHNQEMVSMERERQRWEEERLMEVRRTRQVQERLLDIEEEREKRRRY